ncbi:MAG: cyclodeaminase/cyclohydrolase family protein [Candidatus Eremiobacteraeota bacterium]|nr:cyclodeaminase/cyclohydrolase family protein [Candidatus Eremiobacteraeota bacterium]
MESYDDYLTRLASKAPTPGGGSAATLVAASGAALVAMVARICQNSSASASLAGRLIVQADGLRTELLAARHRDEAAFERVVEVQAMPKGDTRARAMALALRHAAEAPLHAAHLALEVIRLAARGLEFGNRNLESDLGCAAEFGAAAIAACAYNVRINHRFMRDPVMVEAQAKRLARLERESAALLQQVRRAIG